MKYTVSLDLLYTPEPDDRVTMEEFLDEVMDQLRGLDGVEGPSIISDNEKREVLVAIRVHNDSPEAALIHGVSAVRTAIHTCGGKTPGWERLMVRAYELMPESLVSIEEAVPA